MRIYYKLLLSLLATVPTLAKLNGSCSNGKKGICVNTTTCNNYKGTISSGFCPNDPNNVKCCSNISCKYNGKSGTCMFTSECKNGTTYSGLCPGGSNFKCCIKNTSSTGVKGVGETCHHQGVSGKCINTNNTKCGTTLVTGICPGPANVKCCLNKHVDGNSGSSGVAKSCSYEGVSGKCINTNNTKCGTTLVTGKCPGAANIKCCLNKKVPSPSSGSSVSSKSSSSIVNNLRKNLKVSASKKEAMLAAAEAMVGSYDARFIAGLLGNIQDEGTPGLFESSNYKSNPSAEPAYLKYMDNNFSYRTKYSGKSITNVGISSAVTLANKAKNSGFKGKFGLGMIQWTGGRTNNLLAEYQRLSSSNNPSLNECARIEAQFMVKELKNSYSSIYKTWQNNPTPYNAGYLICKKYEVPVNTETKAKKRGNNASAIYKLM